MSLIPFINRYLIRRSHANTSWIVNYDAGSVSGITIDPYDNVYVMTTSTTSSRNINLTKLTKDGDLVYQKTIDGYSTDENIWTNPSTNYTVDTPIAIPFWGQDSTGTTYYPRLLTVSTATGNALTSATTFAQTSSKAGFQPSTTGWPGVVVDTDGSIFYAGYRLDLYGSVLKFDQNLTPIWTLGYSATFANGFNCVTIDSSHVYAAGGFYKGTAPNNINVITKIAKSPTPTTFVWTKHLIPPSTNDELIIYDIAVDSNGNIYSTGRFYNSSTATTTFNTFVCSISADGSTINWARQISNVPLSSRFGLKLAIDSQNNIYVQMYNNGSIGYIFKYNSSGVLQFQRQIYFESSFPEIKGKGLALSAKAMHFAFEVRSSPRQCVVFKMPLNGSKTGKYVLNNNNLTANYLTSNINEETISGITIATGTFNIYTTSQTGIVGTYTYTTTNSIPTIYKGYIS